MSVLELSDLVKVLEEKFGVSAQAVAVAYSGSGRRGGLTKRAHSILSLKKQEPKKYKSLKSLERRLVWGLRMLKI